jgi:DNA-directed RNA polymerase subunit M/transcription elongation factor TFIIS
MSTSPRTPFPANADECPECKEMALPVPKSEIVSAIACQACGAIIDVKNGIMEVSPRTKGTKIETYYVTFFDVSPFFRWHVEVEASSRQKAVEEVERHFGKNYCRIKSAKDWADVKDLHNKGRVGRTLKAY